MKRREFIVGGLLGLGLLGGLIYYSLRSDIDLSSKQTIKKPVFSEEKLDDMVSNFTFADSFKIPDELKPMFKHWVNIFTEYSEDEIIVTAGKHHDVLAVEDMSDKVKDFSYAVAMDVKKRESRKLKADYRYLLGETLGKRSLDSRALEGIFSLFSLINKFDTFNSEFYSELAADTHTFLGQREKTIEGIQRAGRYITGQTPIFEEYGMHPHMLIGIQLSESKFNPNAYNSFSGATGSFQMMSVHVRRNEEDFRTDPFKSAERMAETYSGWRSQLTGYCEQMVNEYGGNWTFKARDETRRLVRNHELLPWEWVLWAHNPGPGNLRKAFKSVGPDVVRIIQDYDENPRFGFSSKNHFITTMASAFVFENRDYFFPGLELDNPIIKAEKGEGIYGLWSKYGDNAPYKEWHTRFKEINGLKSDMLGLGKIYTLPKPK